MMRAGTWIVGLALILADVTVLADEREPSYVGVDKCGRCHAKEIYGDQVSAWRKGRHATALETLASEKAADLAQQRGIVGPPQQADECLKCHVTAHGVDSRRIKYELDPADGVQCESCHGPGSDYRGRSVMADHAKAVERGMACPLDRHLPQSELCRSCHNSDSPTWDPERYVLPDGTRTGFDYGQAVEQIMHRIPEERRGRILELENALRQKKSNASER